MELTIKGNTYAVGKMDVFTQFHVARRLAPIMYCLSASLIGALRNPGKAIADKDEFTSLLLAAGPMVDVLAHMSDADSQYVLNETLLVCQRRSGAGFAAVMARDAKRMQFDDIDLGVMSQLVFASIRESLGNFLDALPDLPPAPVAENTPA